MTLVFGLLGTLCLPAWAQSRTAAPPIKPALPATPPALESAPPPYETQLLRLAELLGALTYLRDLCGFADGEDYRNRMALLLDAEAASGSRRDKIAGSFNRGFRGYEALHRTCTPVSREVVRRAMEEGTALARDIGRRFGAS